MSHKLQGKVTIEGGEPEMPLYAITETGGQVTATFYVRPNGLVEEEIPQKPDAVVFSAVDKNNGWLLSRSPHRLAAGPGSWPDADLPFATDIPWEKVDSWGEDALKESWAGNSATYTLNGRVVTRTADGETRGVPYARVEILEHDPERKRWWAVPSDPFSLLAVWPQAERRDTLGVVFTDQDGNFTYSFNWAAWTLSLEPGPGDPRPDVVVRVSQEIGGKRVELVEKGPWMSLETFTDLEPIEVPIDRVLLLPNPSLSSSVQGFQAIGLLPVDSTRIKDGYADNVGMGDLVECKSAPFGGVLELYAHFGDSAVTHYRLSRAPAGTTDFEPITDGLINYRWDSAKKIWKNLSLGPMDVGPAGQKEQNFYRSIEGEPGYLFGPKLKARWSTYGLASGKYTVKIEGYGEDPTTGRAEPVTGAVYTLDLRIDNTRPKVALEGLYKGNSETAESECGIIDLTSDPKQPLRVKLKVRDPEGHLGAWRLSTSWGRGHDAGDEFKAGESYAKLQNPGIAWRGPGETEVSLPVGGSKGWKECAYGFYLYAVGRSTNGRSAVLSSQETGARLNTYIQV